MNDATKETLASIEAMLVRNFTSPRDALLAAYRLGKFDGMLEMAAIGQEQVEDLLRKAA
jgi:hypothetical protein